MKSRLQRILPVLLFSLILFALPFFCFMLDAPWPVLAVASVFSVGAILLVRQTVREEIALNAIGELSLTVPQDCSADQSLALSVKVANRELAGKTVIFTVSAERYTGDGSWREQWSARVEAPIARGPLTAEAALKIPRGAPPTSTNRIAGR